MTLAELRAVESAFAEDFVLQFDGASYVSEEWDTNVLPTLRQRAERDALTRDEYQELLFENWRIASDLFQALHTNCFGARLGEEPKYYWRHQSFDMLRTHDFSRGIAIDKASLSAVAALYLSRADCRSNRLDWIFLDSSVFTELEAYGHHVLASRAGTGIDYASIFADRSAAKYLLYTALFWFLRLAFSIGVGPVLAFYLYRTENPVAAIVVAATWTLWIVFRIATYPVRWKLRRKAAHLLKRLVDLYAMLGETTISPRKFKEALDQAAADGVVVDASVFSIADRLMARDPTAFIPTQQAQ